MNIHPHSFTALDHLTMLSRCFVSSARQLARPSFIPVRCFHASFISLKDEPTGSLFSDFTKATSEKGLTDTLTQRVPSAAPKESSSKGSVDTAIANSHTESQSIDYSTHDFSNDPEVVKFNHPTPTKAPELILSPLRVKLYKAAIEQYGSYPGPESPITIVDEFGLSKTYNLQLSHKELEYLEPSVYITSTRIKGSYKKGTVFTRLLRQMDLVQAITQCHFSPKRMARDVGEMLTKAMDHARELDLDPKDLYIEQIWVGKDGFTMKELEVKGRGRTGVIQYPYIHVKAILRTKDYREKKLQEKKERAAKKEVYQQIHNSPIKVYRGQNQYQW